MALTLQESFEQTKINDQTVILGDCFDVMKSWPDGYVDGIICSPPFRDADITLEPLIAFNQFSFIEGQNPLTKSIRRYGMIL